MPEIIMSKTSEKEKEEEKTAFKRYDEKIDELYRLRDRYYVERSDQVSDQEIEKESDSARREAVNDRLNKLVAEIESDEAAEISKSERLVLLGKAMNVMPEYDERAFEALTRAIKLEPGSSEAWNALAECYWKNKDFDMCRSCFERSLAIERTKAALRGLSIVMRQLMKIPTTSSGGKRVKEDQTSSRPNAETIRSLLEESIRYAKEAVQMDPSDGMSWYTLANSYVSKFFSPFGVGGGASAVGENAGVLKQAMQAFTLAARDRNVAAWQSDLYYNKAMLGMYEETWGDVVASLARALDLEPCWREVRESFAAVLVYLTLVDEAVRDKGKLKPKRFQALLDPLSKPLTQTDLGPYYDLIGNNANSTSKITLTQAKLSELERGSNPNKLLVGKVVSVIPVESISKSRVSIVCYTCCVVDSAGDCAAVSIYNLAAGQGLVVGDTVAVPEPWCERFELAFDLADMFAANKSPRLLDKILADVNDSDCLLTPSSGGESRADPTKFRFSFQSIRVENPLVLCVNGKKWTKEKLSSAFFIPKVLSD